MFNALLHVGIIVTSFFFIPGVDIRDIKMAMAMCFAFSLLAVELNTRGIGRFPNKWLPVLLIYLPISVILSPAPSIKLLGIDVSYFWSWETLLHIVIFSIMAMAISSHEFSQRDIELLLKNMTYCGAFLSAYMIMQYFKIDQFFKPIESFLPGQGNVAGFIGNPTLTAPYVAMLIPIAIFLRKYVVSIVMVLAVFATQSQVAYIAMITSLIFFIATRGPRRFCLSIGIVFLSISLFLCGYAKYPSVRKFVEPHERLEMWKQTAKDINSQIAPEVENCYPLTGRGIGSYKFVFHTQHPGTDQNPNRFFQAHNDPLEFAYGTGLVGIFLLFMGILRTFTLNLNIREVLYMGSDEYRSALLASFLCICLCSLGTFVWQIGPLIFLTVILVGLLHNKQQVELIKGA